MMSISKLYSGEKWIKTRNSDLRNMGNEVLQLIAYTKVIPAEPSTMVDLSTSLG